MKNKHKVGTYEPFVQRKGVEEMSGRELKDGEVYYTIYTERGGGYDTQSQTTAEVISRLVRIEEKLKKIENEVMGINEDMK